MAKLVAENRNRLMVPQIQIVIDDTSCDGNDSIPINSFNGNGRHWDNDDDDGEYGYELDMDEYFDDDDHRYTWNVVLSILKIIKKKTKSLAL